LERILKQGGVTMINNSRRSTVLLAILLIVDVILISFHFLHRLAIRGIIQSALFSNTIFSMSEEAKLPDIYFYLKQFAIILLLLYVSRKKARVYAAWSLIFSYLLFDDIFMIHERLGFIFQDIAPPIGNIHPAEIAQSGYLVLLAVFLFGISLLIIWRTKGEPRLVSIYLTGFLAAAAFFGVFVDIVQGIVMDMFGISGIVKIVEDGGEMMIFSFIVWYVYRLAFETIPIIRYQRILPRFRTGHA
jgi:hypothetical protein